MIDWKNPEEPPKENTIVILYIKIFNVFQQKDYNNFVVGEYYHNKFVIDEPPTHDYPANYFGGEHKVLKWAEINEPIKKNK